MKYRSPILIYDQIAAKWLYRNTEPAKLRHSIYFDYCERWQSTYQLYDDQIREACADLTDIKKFTLACDETNETLIEWTSSRWFQERVFDYFMQNEASWRDPF